MIVVRQVDWMAYIKAVFPPASVLSGEAPQERREVTVSSFAFMAAIISGVLPCFVFGCKEMIMVVMRRSSRRRMVMIMMMMMMDGCNQTQW